MTDVNEVHDEATRFVENEPWMYALRCIKMAVKQGYNSVLVSVLSKAQIDRLQNGIGGPLCGTTLFKVQRLTFSHTQRLCDMDRVAFVISWD